MENQDFSLHEAVRLNAIGLAREILHNNPSCVNEWDVRYESALHLVYTDIYFPDQADDRLPMIQLLLDYGADVNSKSGYNETPLYGAVLSSQVKGVKFLLENGADPNIWIHGNTSILHCSITRLAISDEIVKLLLKHGAKPNMFFYDGPTPLDYAISNDIIVYANILLEAGGKCNNLYHSIIESAQYGRPYLIQFILNHADKIDLHGSFSVRSLLKFVSSSDQLYFIKRVYDYNYKLMEQLSKLGFDINARLEEERTALHIAVCDEDKTRISVLLRAGADVNAKTLYGDTPLHFLLGQKRREITSGLSKTIDIVKLLLQYGADIKALNDFGITPFQMALAIGDIRIVNLMLTKITGVEITSEEKVFPWLTQNNMLCELCVAATLGYEKVVDRLIDMKFCLQTNEDIFQRMRPLFYAIKARQFNIVKMLLEADFRSTGYFPYTLPLLNLQNYEDVDFRLACLMFEYNVVPLVKRTLCGAFDNVQNPEENKLLFLLIFYYARDLHLKKLNKEFIPMRGVFKSNKKLSAVLALCNDKLTELKEDKICDKLSKFNVLSMELDSLVKFLNNEDCIEACRNLSATLENQPDLRYDEYIIKFRIDLAIEKREALYSAKNILSRDLQDVLKFTKLKVLPDEILWKILSYFNMRELKKYSVEVFDTHKDEEEK